MKNITLINTRHQDILENIYEGLYRNVIDISSLRGTNTICTYDTINKIKKIVNDQKKSLVYFLGNGNFHYLTFPIVQRFKEPFTLIIFDHHNDAGTFPYENVTTCGSWINDVIENNKAVTEVLIIGSTQQNEKGMVTKNKRKIRFLYEKDMTQEKIEKMAHSIQTKQIYISIDRDILTEEQVQTNWDQGNVTVNELIKAVRLISKSPTGIGAEVCVDLEWDSTADFRYPIKKYLKQSVEVNKELFSVLDQEIEQ
ncbi:MAG: arginase family protein [Pisciglobus halotolerans]|nr:arginase family protein [Pisciglobus halotolerans]